MTTVKPFIRKNVSNPYRQSINFIIIGYHPPFGLRFQILIGSLSTCKFSWLNRCETCFKSLQVVYQQTFQPRTFTPTRLVSNPYRQSINHEWGLAAPGRSPRFQILIGSLSTLLGIPHHYHTTAVSNPYRQSINVCVPRIEIKSRDLFQILIGSLSTLHYATPQFVSYQLVSNPYRQSINPSTSSSVADCARFKSLQVVYQPYLAGTDEYAVDCFKSLQVVYQLSSNLSPQSLSSSRFKSLQVVYQRQYHC